MSNKVAVILSLVEADHVLSLLLKERGEGSYYGSWGQHRSRQARIIKKLEAVLREDPTP